MEMHDMLDHIEHEIYCVREAIDLLAEVDNADGIIQAIEDDVLRPLLLEKERCHMQLEEEDAEDQRALTREYYRSVL